MGKTIREEAKNKKPVKVAKKSIREMATPGIERGARVRNILIGNMNLRIEDHGNRRTVLPTRIKSHIPVIESAVEERFMDLGNGNTYKVDIISVRRVMKDVPRDRIHRRF